MIQVLFPFSWTAYFQPQAFVTDDEKVYDTLSGSGMWPELGKISLPQTSTL